MRIASALKKILLAFIVLMVSISLWVFFGFLGVLIFILYFILAMIILCRGEKTSIPFLNAYIRNSYFNATFNIARINNEISKEGASLKRRIALLANKIRFKIFYYAVLICNNSKNSFEILREELQKKHKKSISLKVEEQGQEQVVDIEYLIEKIKKGQMQEKDKELVNRLMDKLYQLHTEKRKKIAAFSFTGIIIIVIATALSNILLSLILPILLKTK